MPFGISVAPEIFQQRSQEAIESLDGVFAIADDRLIAGNGFTYAEALNDHDRKLEMFLKQCQKKQICLNKDNFRLKLGSVAFMGHLLTDEGIKPDTKKITAIHLMQKPTDVAGVRRMLGMVTYLAKFMP